MATTTDGQTQQKSSIVNLSLDDYFQSTPIGSINKAIGNNLYGINHRQTPSAVPSNRDNYGLTFFVRPQLNLQADNIRNLRRFYPMLTQTDLTLQRFVRCTLDPRLMVGYTFNKHKVSPISCPMVDPQCAFIPVLSNNINTISGWPDEVVNPYVSKPGLYNEAYSFIDGRAENFEAYDLDATFRNTRGDPIAYLFSVWKHYMSAVFEGKLVPYIDMICENEIDYNTRIYRLVLDQAKETVTKIGATGAAFPISDPTGSFFDYNKEKPFNDQNKDIPIRFKSMGAIYYDDILIYEFNKTVEIFNEAMSDDYRSNNMIQIDKSLATLFNHRGYPRINPNNNKLEWYVDRDIFNQRTSAFLNAGLIQQSTIDELTLGD
jgi:hypothetical protein